MVKNLKKLLQSSWIRRSCVLMSCVLILICCLAPSASAFMIDDTDGTKFGSILKGSMTLRFMPTSDDAAGSVTNSYQIGGMLPYPPTTGANYYGEETENYLLSIYNTPEWNVQTVSRLARYKSVINNYSFDRARYNIGTYEYLDGQNRAYYNLCEFRFDPLFFDNDFNDVVFTNLINLRLTSETWVQTIVQYSFYGPGLNSLRNGLTTSSWTGGNSNIVVYYPLQDAAAEILNDVGSGGSVYITNIYILVSKPDFSYDLTGVSFELLSEQWSKGQPRYIYLDTGGEYASSQISAQKFSVFANNSIKRDDGGSGGGSTPSVPVDPGVGGQFTRFLAGAVSGFFDVEIMDGFSLGGVMAAIIAVVVILLLLKFFSGG